MTPSKINEYLPDTYKILIASQLTVHPYVYKVVLSGSRGLAGNYREDSDIDLSLLVDINRLKNEKYQEKVLKDILNVTIGSWVSSVELDTVAIFDINDCSLNCFNSKSFADLTCKKNGVDCMGLYKIQKGFNGYVPKMGIDINKIYPITTVWEREI